VLIPQILTQPTDLHGQPCEWMRLQFPVQPAFAMSINKSQGQTLHHVIIWLESSAFGHGQLYVAGLCVGHPIARFFVREGGGGGVSLGRVGGLCNLTRCMR
jgi:ATP-dependent DNA helicase PIF1